MTRPGSADNFVLAWREFQTNRATAATIYAGFPGSSCSVDDDCIGKRRGKGRMKVGSVLPVWCECWRGKLCTYCKITGTGRNLTRRETLPILAHLLHSPKSNFSAEAFNLFYYAIMASSTFFPDKQKLRQKNYSFEINHNLCNASSQSIILSFVYELFIII